MYMKQLTIMITLMMGSVWQANGGCCGCGKADKSIKLSCATTLTVQVKGPYARATVAKNGAVYMSLSADQACDLVAVEVGDDVCDHAELHTHVYDAQTGIARMRPVDKIALPAHKKAIELKPGGLHIMLMGLKKPLKEGDTLTLTLVFKGKSELKQTITVPVMGVGAMGQKSAGGCCG
jgi:copper(I)-binding protein